MCAQLLRTTTAYAGHMARSTTPATDTRWLDADDRDPHALLKPCPSDWLRAWPANPAVGNVRNQGQELLGE